MGRKPPKLTESQRGMVARALSNLTVQYREREDRHWREYERERKRLEYMLESGVVPQTTQQT